MSKLHLKKLGLVLCLAVMPWLAHAASLGKLSVFSSLGEPLNAEIDVFPGTDEELNSLAAALASDAVYREQGVERSAAQSDVQMIVLKKDDGSVVVKLNSTHPISDPFLDMMIALTWKEANGKDGNLVREYTLLLDPPGQTSAAVNNANVDAPKAITTVKAMDPAKETNSNILVKNGDSLAMIAKRVQMPGLNLDQLLVAFYLENKQAFAGENMNRLKAGVSLKIPSQETLAAVTQEEAKKEVQAQAADWSVYKNKLANAVAESAASEEVNNQTNSGKVIAKADESSLPAETARDVVKLSKSEGAQPKDPVSHVDALKDDLAAKQNAIADTEEKTGAVEKQIADMKQLLAIKNQSLANTQNNAEQSGGSKTPEVVTLWQTMPVKTKVLAAVVALLGLALLLLRRKSTKKPALPVQEPIINVPTVGAAGEADIQPAPAVDDVPQLKSFDLSSISLDFEPVVAPVQAKAEAEPIPDAFNGDFSNLLKVEPAAAVKPAKKAPNAPAKSVAKTIDFSDVETKLELAVAYIDMRDKRGAKKLLNEVLKEGDESQKARAQAFIDQLK